MSRQRMWDEHTSSSRIISHTMYHASPSIALQPESENKSAAKTPALQLLLSDVTAPSYGHTTHDVNEVLSSSEWDLVQQLQQPPIPEHGYVDVCSPNLFVEEHMAVSDYLSCLLPTTNEQQVTQSSIRVTAQDERSECELSQLPLAQYNDSTEQSVHASLEGISAREAVKTQHGGAEWTSVPIRQTVVPASCLAQPITKAAHGIAESSSWGDSRPKLRFSKGASASKYCHICGRNSKTVAVAQCANVMVGLCRKVVCEKCLMLHREEIGVKCSTPRAEWKCTHCEGVCPKKARCHQYTKNNLRRRMKNDSKQRKKVLELRRKRAELALEERALNQFESV